MSFLGKFRVGKFTIFMFMFCGMLIGFGLGLIASGRDPISMRSIKQTENIVLRGGWIDLEFKLIKSRDCSSRAERWLWQPTNSTDFNYFEYSYTNKPAPSQNTRWVELNETAIPPMELNKEINYKLTLPIPVNVPPGKWFYLSISRDSCSKFWPLYSETVRVSQNVPLSID